MKKLFPFLLASALILMLGFRCKGKNKPDSGLKLNIGEATHSDGTTTLPIDSAGNWSAPDERDKVKELRGWIHIKPSKYSKITFRGKLFLTTEVMLRNYAGDVAYKRDGKWTVIQPEAAMEQMFRMFELSDSMRRLPAVIIDHNTKDTFRVYYPDTIHVNAKTEFDYSSFKSILK